VARENKFARRMREREAERHRNGAKKFVARDPQPSVDDQLVRLEDDIRKLKVEFDIFFNGAAKRPPYDTKNRVETLVKRLADERNLTFAQRYRYNSLVARYVAFRDLWRRTMQDREEGRGAVAAARAKLGLGEAEAGLKERQASFVCADARSDVPTVKGLYDALVAAKRSCGEPTDDLSFSQFHRMIAAKTDTLKERLGCERVRYSVYMEGGRVSFKAKADR
jgi:hypothetical protein